MYRFWLFVCYCFLYRPNLFQAHSWTGLNLPIPPSQSARTRLSSLFLPPFVSPHLHLNTSSPVCVLLSRPFTSPPPHVVARPSVKPCCGVMTRSQALSVLALRLILKVRDWSHYCSLTAAYWTCLAPLDDKMDQNSSQSLGRFLPVQWKCNVTWSYA